MPLLVCAVLASACGTSYTPRSNGRISIVRTATGAPALMKDGKRCMMGDPSELVAGNPAAEEYARSYRRRMHIMLGFLPLAGLSLGSGAATLATFHENSGGTVVGLGLVLVGMAAIVAIPVTALMAQSSLHDAINVYNDGVTDP